MNSISSYVDSNHRRLGIAAMVVILSVAFPTLIVVFSVPSLFSDRPMGMISSDQKSYADGSIRDGVLWYPVIRFVSGGKSTDLRLKRLDLKTGLESETGLAIDNAFGGPIWARDELYVITETAIYQSIQSKLVLIGPRPRKQPGFDSGIFALGDHLATVVVKGPSEFRLALLTKGEWVEGRTIALPGMRIDRHDRPPDFHFSIMHQDDQLHLLIACGVSFYGYRTEIDISNDATNVVSASKPENTPLPAGSGGWEVIPSDLSNSFFAGSGHDSDGIVFGFLSYSNRPHFIRRNRDHQWKELATPEGTKRFGNVGIVVDSLTETAYVIEEVPECNFATVDRIEGNAIIPIGVKTSGDVYAYLTHRIRLLLTMVLAWIIHCGVIIAGVALSTSSASYSFGFQHIVLARFLRRAIAFAVDLLLLSLFLSGVVSLLLAPFCNGIKLSWAVDPEVQLTRDLLEMEESYATNPINRMAVSYSAQQLLRIEFERLPTDSEIERAIGTFILILLITFVLKFYVEGRYGITPGKWLFGIRTLRTTLRPCGFARALARNLLIWVDVPLIITPIPAALSMIFSESSQRLGDRVADTLVVTAGSTRTEERRIS